MQITNQVEEVLQSCPPVDSGGHSSDLSDRYQFISTRHVANMLGRHGWTPRQAFYIRSKNSETSDPLYKKHCIRFRSEQYLPNKEDGFGGVSPEIVVTNSHDGTCSLHLQAGLFRMVCSNGLTITEETYGDVRMRHDNANLRSLGDIWLNATLRQFTTSVPNGMASIKGWNELDMGRQERRDFYKKAGELRNMEMYDYRYNQFDQAQRRSDQSNDLWTVYNRTQEYLTKGGVTNYYDFQPDSKIIKRELTPLASSDRIESVNRSLWDLTLETAASLN